MMPLLLDLTVRGLIATLVVFILDLALANHMHPRWRRAWWVLAALAWIFPFHLPRYEALPSLPLPHIMYGIHPSATATTSVAGKIPSAVDSDRNSGPRILFILWLAGAGTTFLLVVVRTVGAARRWNRERLCTDPMLLNLLEDCKSAAGITAPIGLVLTSSVSMPALLGWLRPRILLPHSLPSAVSTEQLRGILLHELAHFRSADIPLHWLFTIVQALHWFNPIAHLAVRRWRFYRELAADAAALGWLPGDTRNMYGEALIDALRHSHDLPVPRGALALGESIDHLKTRLSLIARDGGRQYRRWLAALVAAVLVLWITLPSRAAAVHIDPAEAKTHARAVAESWLKMVDDRDYAASWAIASSLSQKAFTFDSWHDLCEKSRRAVGKCQNRKLISSTYCDKIPESSGGFIRGDFVIFNFDSSFENLPAAQETVWIMNDVDGEWRPCGYLVNPR